ncbi:LysR family transcriptional regulator, partial [Streptomyces chryseus]
YEPGHDLRTTPLARPGRRRTIALAHRSDVAPPRAARELQNVLLASRVRQTASASSSV